MRSIRFVATPCLGLSLLLAASAYADQPDQVEGLAMENGRCQSLVAVTKDLSPICSGKLLNTFYKGGRSGFYFMTRDGGAITFSGDGNGQIRPGVDVVIQPIDLVIFGKSHERQKAVGSCRFSNPFHGIANVQCEALTAVGPFKGAFVTDGKQPEMKRF